MPRFIITEKAGLYVAGYRNNGVGTALDLTEKQAEHELRLGTLIRSKDEPEPAPAEDEEFATVEEAPEDAAETGVEAEEGEEAPEAPEAAPASTSAPLAAKKGRRR